MSHPRLFSSLGHSIRIMLVAVVFDSTPDVARKGSAVIAIWSIGHVDEMKNETAVSLKTLEKYKFNKVF